MSIISNGITRRLYDDARVFDEPAATRLCAIGGERMNKVLIMEAKKHGATAAEVRECEAHANTFSLHEGPRPGSATWDIWTNSISTLRNMAKKSSKPATTSMVIISLQHVFFYPIRHPLPHPELRLSMQVARHPLLKPPSESRHQQENPIPLSQEHWKSVLLAFVVGHICHSVPAAF
ncbi:hypothetical protein J7T55_011011 [Diaporthe amygdali]|uniref:uncharacterized protein n=1 Tax=Phomopsis amygdali TaxID=1214568 RepID=UPI0022FF265B|nr:uncharacterized protein J7T55_011011 [Diaporthe amygdali]KAJ0103741.1 hypothetical protein J7T55_011011 [Diaporthe amygdali]